mmetsp:Transcript_19163/g.62434  ORF Transcript_19163/g.62434 Transcript_19163/m.62434 type:complete len:223 (+) Transcript_19163:467-1135(+)
MLTWAFTNRFEIIVQAPIKRSFLCFFQLVQRYLPKSTLWFFQLFSSKNLRQRCTAYGIVGGRGAGQSAGQSLSATPLKVGAPSSHSTTRFGLPFVPFTAPATVTQKSSLLTLGANIFQRSRKPPKSKTFLLATGGSANQAKAHFSPKALQFVPNKDSISRAARTDRITCAHRRRPCKGCRRTGWVWRAKVRRVGGSELSMKSMAQVGSTLGTFTESHPLIAV